MTASFSARGPTYDRAQIKPDLAAPGVAILSASSNNPFLIESPVPFEFQSGTSESAPMVAGAAALVKQAHPDWSAFQIKSALMTTADQAGITKEDKRTPADFFDVGSGRVNVARALDPGLTFAPFPSLSILANVSLSQTTPVARYVVTTTNVTTQSETYAITLTTPVTVAGRPAVMPTVVVSPASLSVAPGTSAAFAVEVRGTPASGGEYFSQVNLTGSWHTAHLPLYLRIVNVFDLTKTVAPGPAKLGAPIPVTLTLTNTQGAGNTFVVTDNLPPGLTVLSGTVTGGAA